jgi:hypothetical protein
VPDLGPPLRWSKDWLPAAGGADKSRAEEGGTVRVIDEIFTQKCGLVDEIGGMARKRALLGGGGGGVGADTVFGNSWSWKGE